MHLSPSCSPQLFARADRSRTRQILLNLLSIAVKYNRWNGTVSGVCEASDVTVRITIADTGPGILPARQGEIFQPFQRLGAENTNIKGTA